MELGKFFQAIKPLLEVLDIPAESTESDKREDEAERPAEEDTEREGGMELMGGGLGAAIIASHGVAICEQTKDIIEQRIWLRKKELMGI